MRKGNCDTERTKYTGERRTNNASILEARTYSLATHAHRSSSGVGGCLCLWCARNGKTFTHQFVALDLRGFAFGEWLCGIMGVSL